MLKYLGQILSPNYVYFTLFFLIYIYTHSFFFLIQSYGHSKHEHRIVIKLTVKSVSTAKIPQVGTSYFPVCSQGGGGGGKT